MSDNPSHHMELLLVREANEDTDSPAETHLTKKRIASEEFLHKYRKGMPFEGPHPDHLTEQEFNRINTRWEKFFREKKGLIDYLADYDEDLSSIAILGTRRMIAMYPDCPDSWLVAEAKRDITRARYWGGCLDSGRRRDQRDDIGYVTHQPVCDRLENLLYDKQQFRLLEQLNLTGSQVEQRVNDEITALEFYKSLDTNEKRLVDIMTDEYRGDPGWYHGQYRKSVETSRGPKRRFKAEVSDSETEYVVTYVSLRRKFYERFGSAQEVEQETEWCKNWDPTKPIHRDRGTGLYERTGKYAKKKESTRT